MNKDENIGKKVLSTDNEQLANDHCPEDSHAPKPQTTNQHPITEDIEVHKHPHHVTHKKKWTEYLLEFAMLFMAVFPGFIAGNMREHYVEHQREKQYASQLLSDLRKDSTFFMTRNEVIERTFAKSCIKELFAQQQHPAAMQANTLIAMIKKEYHFE